MIAEEGDKMEVKTVSTEEEAIKVWRMFLIPDIIGPLSEGEKLRFKENIFSVEFFYKIRIFKCRA